MPTKEQRQKLAHELSKKTRAWLTASDAELFAELKQVFPAVAEATREECVRTLTLFHVDKMI